MEQKTRYFRQHTETFCDNSRCSSNQCNLRHPRKCQYFYSLNYCKFGEFCRFTHTDIHSNIKTEIASLTMEIRNLKNMLHEKKN